MTEQAAPPAPEPISPEQLEKLKIGWVEKARELYTNFLNSIVALPGHQIAKGRSYGHFDDGYLWLKESILNIQSMVQQQAPQGIAVGEQCGAQSQPPAEDQPAPSPAE